MMPQPVSHPRTPRRLLSSCAMGITLAALAHGGTASAQVSAIQGTGTVDAGFANIDNTGGTTAAPRTNVQVFGSNAVINWTPTDSTAGSDPIDFLPANGLAYFYSSTDPNFIVLNRIIPATTRQIGLNGEVRSNLDISGTTSAGGNVWFYSPTGFVAGTGSKFSTNGLILTANDIPYTTGSGSGITFGPNGEIQMTAVAGSQANITLLAGARISNTSDDAYTLIVAPQIVQGGTIELDGSVGLIAAESVSVIIQNSLFDINVQIGTSVANAIVHTGSTGAGATGDTLQGPQQVVVMATPANTALTVLLGGSLGATAVNATAANRSVILSGGYDYAAIAGSGLAVTPDSTTPANFQIDTTTFNSDVNGLTTGSIIGNPSRGGAITFGGNASLTAGTTVGLTADLDETITAAGNLSLFAPISATLKLGTTNAEAGSTNNAARIAVTGDLTVSADVSSVDPLVNGAAGTATISLDAGAVGPQLSVTGATLVSATGVGAESSTLGGNGIGGTAQIIVNGGTLSLASTQIIANGTGAGGTPGGSGTAGLAQFIATDPQGYTLGDLTISANGTAGDTIDPSSPAGVGTGGTAKFVNQGSAGVAQNSRSIGNLTLEAIGDAGSVFGQPGIDSFAGLIQLSDLATGANGHAHFTSVSGQSRGETTPAGKGALLEVAGGTTVVDTSFDISSGGDITLAASGVGSFDGANVIDLSAGRDIVITHTGQGAPPTPTLAGGNIDIDAVRNVNAGPGSLLAADNSIVVTARTGTATLDSLSAADRIEVHARGDVFLKNAATTSPPSRGLIYLTAGNDPVELVGPYQPATITISGNVNASGDLIVHAGANILGGSAASLLEGDTASVIAEGSISGANLTIRSRSNLALGVGTSLTAGTIDVAGQLDMVDAAGNVILPAQLNVASNLSVGNLVLRAGTPALVRASGDLTLGRVFAASLDVATDDGALSVGGLDAYPGGLSGFLTASAPTTIALDGIHVSGNITAATTLANVGSITIGSTQAGGTLSLTTPGLVAVNGQAAAAIVRVSSSDVAIGNSGSIGAAGTTSLVELTNNNAARRSYYGGADNAAGYSLSGAEMGRLFGSAITLIAPQTQQSSAATPDVTVGDMTITGTQLGAQGTLAIQTPGRVAINGAANFTGLSNANTFAIRAGALIALDTAAGAVDLRGANNALAGRIDFSADTIVAASSAAQTALTGLSDPATIDTVLGSNDGNLRTAGVLRADSMRFSVTNGLYIQNTGTSTFFPLRRGFTVGAGGIAISTPVGRTTPLIVINGQATTSAGVNAFGLETIPLVSINGQPAPSSTGSLAGSTINGCDFTNIGDCRPPLTPELTLTRDRVQGSTKEITDSPSDLAVERQSLVTPGVELQDIGRLSYEPLIDEPVTGSGNDDLWVPGCDSAKGNCPAP